jgi:hypothetical protein
MSRQTWRGRGFGGEVRGGSSSLTHKGEQYVPFIGDRDMVAQLGTVPTQGLTHFIHLQPLPSQGFRHHLAVVSLYNPWTRGPVRAHPRTYEFATDLQIRTPHLLCSQARSHSHAFIHKHPMFLPSSQHLLVTVLLSLKVILVTPGGGSVSPSATQGQA